MGKGTTACRLRRLEAKVHLTEAGQPPLSKMALEVEQAASKQDLPGGQLAGLILGDGELVVRRASAAPDHGNGASERRTMPAAFTVQMHHVGLRRS
jgi:hypothetical protein